MSRVRTVIFTREELASFGKDIEKRVMQRLHQHNIPVKGFLKLGGLKQGVMRARNLPNGSRCIEWWPSVFAAKDDGVDFGEDAETKYAIAGGELK